MIETTKMYNGEVILEFDTDKHKYTVNGNIVDGCTSVLKVIDKPALLPWGVKVTCDYIEKNLKVGVPLDEIQKMNLIKEAKAQHRSKKTDAGDLGTLLHSLVEKVAKKQPYDEPVNPILKTSFDQFRAWVKENEVEFLASERKVYSRQHNVAGTLDLIMRIKGKVVLGDIKTASGVWNEMFLQTNFYKGAMQEEFPDKHIDHVAIIRCGKDGTFEVKEANDFEENFKAFLAALTLYRRLKKMDYDKKQTA